MNLQLSTHDLQLNTHDIQLRAATSNWTSNSAQMTSSWTSNWTSNCRRTYICVSACNPFSLPNHHVIFSFPTPLFDNPTSSLLKTQPPTILWKMFILRLPLVTILFMSNGNAPLPNPPEPPLSPLSSVSYKRKFELLQAEVAASKELVPKAKGYVSIFF